MRKDMGKVVIEAPRGGSRRPNPKVRHFGKFVTDDEGNPDYEGLYHIPSSFRGALLALGDRKDFSDKVGPLEGYLQKSCGRPWDDVYSEIKKVLGNAGWGVQHIVTAHINVETVTYRGVDGNVYACNKHGVEEVGTYHWRSEFYVEPETGILRASKRKVHRREPEVPVEAIPIRDREEYRKVSGIWYHRTWELIEEAGPINQVGRYYKRQERELQMLVLWEKKRQLGKKQLKELGLKNGEETN